MYCRFCGKMIGEDSIYCPYCGKQVNQADSSTERPSQECRSETISNNDVSNSNLSEEGDIIKVMRVSKETNSSKKVADEIIANLKMIGFAILGWLVYMCGAYLYHYSDSKPITELYEWGESCYDPNMVWSSDPIGYDYEHSFWEQVFFHKIKNVLPYSQWKRGDIISLHKKYDSDYLITLNKRQLENLLAKQPKVITYVDYGKWCDYDFSNDPPSEILEKARKLGARLQIPDSCMHIIEKEAKKEAQSNKESFFSLISEKRKYDFEDYLHTQMKWSAIISLCFFIIGRYIIKSVKWVATNRTKNENKNNSLISPQKQIENDSINDEDSAIENT